MNHKTILTVEDLSVTFQMYTKGLRQVQKKILSNVSFSIDEGEILAILGESGSGKSIFAHKVFELLPRNAQSSGTIKYPETEITSVSVKKIRGKKIILILQCVNYLNPLKKIGQQMILDMPKKDKQEKIRAVEAMLLRYGLTKDVLDLYPYEISGGMVRRILVSIAALSSADLIIADEPTPGMDVSSLNETVSLFKQLSSSKRAIIFITHDIDMALELADRVAIFKDGHLIESTNVSSFSGEGERLIHPFTRALWRSLPQNGYYSQKEVEHA